MLAAGGKALDLSQMRFRFEVRAADVETPNTCYVRVYNLKDETVNVAIKEYTRVVVQAGYEDGNFGVIFDGTIKQFKKGKESNTDTFLEIMAADGDLGYNFGVVNKTLAAGSSPQDRAQALADAMGAGLDKNANQYLQSTGGILPRGKVLFGLAREFMRDLTVSTASRWSIQNGTVTIIPLTGYLPGDVVKLTARTGLIGIPEATDGGIQVTTLLNPLLTVGNRVQIDNKSINQTTIKEQGFPQYNALSFPASTDRDGFYRVLVVEHSGDTRGQEWYSHLVCLAVDPSAAPDDSVKAFG